MLQAIKACDMSGFEFNDVFIRQFIITLDANLDVPNYEKISVGSRTVFHCPSLNTTQIKSNEGAIIGVLLGTGIDADGTFLSGTYILPKSPLSVITYIEDHFLKTLAGKYVLVISVDGRELVYGDAAMSMPCVYNPETQIVASSILLTKFDEINPTSYFNGENIYQGSGKFGLGITADRSVFRHQANFTLDLRSFSLSRFWPKTELAPITQSHEDLMLKIQAKLRQNIKAIVTNMDCMFAMSGGRDSRALLGYTKPYADRIHPYHTVKHNWISQFDVASSAKLAMQFGVDHVVYDASEMHKTFPNEDRSGFRGLRRKIWFSKGYVCDISTRMDYALEFMVPRDKTLIRGNMLELLNAQWTPPQLFQHGTLECFKHIIKRSQFLDDPTDLQNHWRLSEITKWYAKLPNSCKPRVYDFAYTELFLSNNQCALQSHAMYYIAPFCDRQIFDWTMQLPLEFRMSNAAHSWLIRKSDVPELAEVPLARQLIEENRKEKRA